MFDYEYVYICIRYFSVTHIKSFKWKLHHKVTLRYAYNNNYSSSNNHNNNILLLPHLEGGGLKRGEGGEWWDGWKSIARYLWYVFNQQAFYIFDARTWIKSARNTVHAPQRLSSLWGLFSYSFLSFLAGFLSFFLSFNLSVRLSCRHSAPVTIVVQLSETRRQVVRKWVNDERRHQWYQLISIPSTVPCAGAFHATPTTTNGAAEEEEKEEREGVDKKNKLPDSLTQLRRFRFSTAARTTLKHWFA